MSNLPYVASRLFAAWLLVDAAQPARAQIDARTRVRDLIAQAEQARSAHDPAQAEKLLEQALRIENQPAITLQLGKLAEQEGRTAAAADLYRRYLDEMGESVDETTKTRLTGLVSGLHEPVAEVDVLGPPGSLLYVDDHLVGMLPLSGPMLLLPTSHRFRLIIKNSAYRSDPLDLLPSLRAQLHLTPGAGGTAVAILSLSSEWLLLIEPADMDPGQRSIVEQSVSSLAKRERATLLSTQRLERAKKSRPADCLRDPACQESVARDLGVRAVVRVHVDQAAGKIRAEWFDVDGGGVAAQRERACGNCQEKAMREAAALLSRELLRDAQNHPRGVLDVSSTPPGAQVVIDGSVRGETPYQRALLVGHHNLKLRLPGYSDYDEPVELLQGQTRQIAATLTAGTGTPLVPQAYMPKKSRPLWRYFVGGGLIATGVLLFGFGANALSQNGTCGDTTAPPAGAPCNYLYNTGSVGGGLLGAGLGLAAGGALMIAWPTK